MCRCSTVLMLSAILLVPLGLSACAGFSEQAGKNAADNDARYDYQKVTAVENAARASGLTVRWVNYPQKTQGDRK